MAQDGTEMSSSLLDRWPCGGRGNGYVSTRTLKLCCGGAAAAWPGAVRVGVRAVVERWSTGQKACPERAAVLLELGHSSLEIVKLLAL